MHVVLAQWLSDNRFYQLKAKMTPHVQVKRRGCGIWKKTASHEWYRKVAFFAGRKFSSEITSAKPQCELPFQPLESNSQGNLSFPCFGLHLLPFRSRTPRVPMCSSNASRSGKINNDNDDEDSKVSRAWSSAVQSCGHSTSNTLFFFTTWIVTTSR